MRESQPFYVPNTLLSWEPGPEPVVSCLIDWRVGGSGRQSPSLVSHRLREEYRSLEERSPARRSLEGDAISLNDFFATQTEPSAIAYVAFASHGRGLWYTSALGVPVETLVHVGDRPQLLPLLEATQDAARTLVVVADALSARLVRLVPSGPVEIPGPHRDIATVQHSTEGGWGALNYQRHVDVEIDRFAGLIAAAMEHEVSARDLGHVVISGDSTIVPPVLEALSPALRARVDSVEHFQRHDAAREISAAAWERVADVVRALREAEVKSLLGRAAGGRDALLAPPEVADAAAAGRVDTLAFDPNVVDASASELLIREALRHRSRVLISRGHPDLASAGGVVASLR